MSASINVTGPLAETVMKWKAGVDRDRPKVCTLRMHPYKLLDLTEGQVVQVQCGCGNFWDEQCCDRSPCQIHGCGPRKGCRCPLTEAEGTTQPTTAEMTGGPSA